jgi:MFS family permease
MAETVELRSRALRFIVLLGLVSLFADMAYEGARSISGPFLATLGASGAAVGVVAGLGELFGYVLRLASGYLADRTRRYWPLTILGYALNLLAVPAMALANRWEVAGTLILAERTGKAFRTPARDAMLSHAARQTGTGWGFGLHEALDQVGAIAGPLLVSGVLAVTGEYRTAFGALLLPALAALGLLLAARLVFPRPQELEPERFGLKARGLAAAFWVYLGAVGLLGAGYADFALVGYHLGRSENLPAETVAVLYGLAMAADAVAALLFGHLFDRLGLGVLVGSSALSALFPPLIFGLGGPFVLTGVVLWGVGLGAQESVMRAAVAGVVPPEQRGTAYGLLNAGYGLMWFFGSALMGLLYDVSLGWLIVFSVGSQLGAAAGFALAARRVEPGGPP